MSVFGWSDPWDEVRRMQRDMDRFFGTPVPQTAAIGARGQNALWRPTTDIREAPNSLVISAELPGVKKEDINITLQNGVLNISGERKEEKKEDTDKYHRQERFYGSFSRSITVPSNVTEDQIKAKFDNGVLEVEIPKIEKKEEEGRRITVG